MAKLVDRLNAASIEAATAPGYYPDVASFILDCEFEQIFRP